MLNRDVVIALGSAPPRTEAPSAGADFSLPRVADSTTV